PRPDWPLIAPGDVERLVLPILTDAQRSRLRAELDLGFGYDARAAGRFRVNLYRQRGTLAAAFRPIRRRAGTVEELGLPASVADLARLRGGLVVVTGPAGSGKSTTLAAMVAIANAERPAHILTLEDPIEFVHEHRTAAI